ncbi:NAD+ synthase [Aquabacterium lacunae]|uniref:Glutamine-dependent NAD(+) synthetase n=1 Tax=Aquabacterium lacunae TaxID=2528630 RepID=A0A4Q9H222_9BURK|nr:NAD+ synthase [Aquabacterium lacunae]TBO32631.1 NAD+ synthase [Aquabacterium lacunae]
MPHSFSHGPLSVAVIQFNPVVGDLAGNARQLVALARQAHADGARLVVTPELSLCGYPPEDLLLRPRFIDDCQSTLVGMAEQLADLPDLQVVVGHPAPSRLGDARTRSWSVPGLVNAASVLQAGAVVGTYAKRDLPNYQVFDERRYFVSGRDAGFGPLVIDAQGIRLGVLICEDAWFDEPADAACAAGAQALLVLNASPFHAGKAAEREQRMAVRATRSGCPLVYAHLVGGQDEVVFDGASFVLDAEGRVQARALSFQSDVLHVQLQAGGPGQAVTVAPARTEPLLDADAEIWAALVTGVRDYIGKNGFPGAIIGLSGGIDSALVLAIAVDALGADKVRTVMMPSPYTADISWIDARDMADRLGVHHDEIAIAPEFEAFKASLAPLFVGRAEDTTEENIQARIRGTLLMALSNKTGAIVLTTGNKSEMATGYCTLYGDMAGGFAVIKDLVKTTVYRLSNWRNAQARAQGQVEPIPERIITRPPSAELRPDQKDQDSLPEYDVLDAILQRYMEQDQSIEDIVAAGYPAADVDKVTRLLKINEYKRRQAPVGIRITHRAFGRDWRYPITSRYRA